MSIIAKLYEIDKEAIDYGFYYEDLNLALDQIISECEEVREVLNENQGRARLEEEVADLLQGAFELCFYLKLDPYLTIDIAIRKFTARFRALQQVAAEAGYKDLNKQPIEFLHALWKEAKTKVKQQNNNFIFKPLTEQDIPIISAAFLNIGWDKPETIYQQYLKEQQAEERMVWVAWEADKFLGYVTLVWQSKYFRNIPEIIDLNVLPQFRQQGVGRRLLNQAENAARSKANAVGIGVGLFADYATAHRLYLNRGYMPDGKGIGYRDKNLAYGDTVTLDDDLVLWLIKKF